MGASLLVTALLVAGLLAPASAVASKLDPDVMTSASPRAIIVFDHDVDGATVERLAAAGVTKATRFDSIDAVGVLGPRAAYAQIARWPDVLLVDDDSPIHFENAVSKRDTRVAGVRRGHRPLHSKYSGGGVTVAVMDTGIADVHPDLDGQVIDHVNFEPAWVFDQIDDGSISDPIAETTGNGIDTRGHGTHVAGTVAGTGESGNGADFSGVAPGASSSTSRSPTPGRAPATSAGSSTRSPRTSMRSSTETSPSTPAASASSRTHGRPTRSTRTPSRSSSS